MVQLELNFDSHIEEQARKKKKSDSGRKAQQDGENVKNSLAQALSCTEKGNFTLQLLYVFKVLQIDKDNVAYVTTRSHEDKGNEPCSKPDLRCTIALLDNYKYTPLKISLKSTFGATQVAIHSVNSFESHLASHGVTIPESVKEFFTHFTNSESLYTNKPSFIYSESQRRQRFTLNEINAFNSQLFEDTKQFLKIHAKEILGFLTSKGQVKDKKGHANYLAFCDKKLDNLLLVNIEDLIDYILIECEKNDSWIVAGKDRKSQGITTLSLFNGLIPLQMKGSGGKETSAYHHLQFRIKGSEIRKLVNNGLIKDRVWN